MRSGAERSAAPQVHLGRREGLRAAPAQRTFHGARGAHAAAAGGSGAGTGAVRPPAASPRARGLGVPTLLWAPEPPSASGQRLFPSVSLRALSRRPAPVAPARPAGSVPVQRVSG